MDSVQEQFEKGIGARFFEWFNSETGTCFSFTGRADRAPDLVYSSNGKELLVEVTAAYYDSAHAEFLWKSTRGAKDAPSGWDGINPDKSLAAAVFHRVAKKSEKRYGNNTVLLIEVPPCLTTAEALSALLRLQPVHGGTPFAGIYVVGRFPITTRSRGGYRVIPLKELSREYGD